MFHPNIFSQDAVLESVRIIHDWGPDTYAAVTLLEEKPVKDKPPQIQWMFRGHSIKIAQLPPD